MTGRYLTAAAEAASRAGHVRWCWLVEMQFGSGVARCNSADRDIVWAGYTWLGVGRVGGITGIREGGTLQAEQVSLTLTGVPVTSGLSGESYVQLAVVEQYQRRPMQIWRGFFDDNLVLIADPVLQWRGRMDTLDIEIGDLYATITLTAQNRLSMWDRPQLQSFTDADQQQRFPGDLGMNFVAQMVQRQVMWGGEPAQPAPAPAAVNRYNDGTIQGGVSKGVHVDAPADVNNKVWQGGGAI